MKGPIGKRNQKLKPFSGLQKQELALELDGRGDQDRIILDEDLNGVNQVPELLFNSPNSSLESLNLESYEVLPCEPIHEITHHNENLLTGIPAQIEDKKAKSLVEAVSQTTGRKETKGAVDFHCFL